MTTPSLETRVAELELLVAGLQQRAEPDFLRWIADGTEAYRLVLAVPGQPIQTLLTMRKDGNGTWALVWGDILPKKDDGSFDTNYCRGLPWFMTTGPEPGASYMTATWLGSLVMGGANDGAELSGFLTDSPDRAAPYGRHAGSLLKINGLSWDNGMVQSSMIALHTETPARQGDRPGYISLYTGAPNDAGDLRLGLRVNPGGLVTARLPVCSVYHSLPQPTVAGAEICLVWDRAEADTDAMHDAANPSRLTAQRTGVYRPWASLGWASTPPGAHSVTLRKNSASIVGRGPGAGGVAYASTDVVLAAGEYVDVWAYQAGGAPSILDSSRAGMSLVSLL